MTVKITTVYDKTLVIQMPRSNEAIDHVRRIMQKDHDNVELKAGNRTIFLHSCDIMFIDIIL